MSFLAGTMDQEESIVKRARKARQKRASAEDLEEARPEQLDTAQNKGGADNLSAMENAQKDLKKQLKKLSRKGSQSEEVDGVKFLFNPLSFTQTVENIFNFSFLIKRQMAEAGVRTPEEGGLYVKYLEKDENDDVQQKDTAQAVVAFTMKDWRRICEGQNLKEGHLKHRTGSKHAPSTMSQSST